MRFDRLRHLTSLPVERLDSAFQREHVTAILPVSEPGSGLATILVATPRKLGVATLRRPAGKGRWITRWAPWDAVRLPDDFTDHGSRLRRLQPAISVDGRSFRPVLGGRLGKVALSDFHRSVLRRRQAYAPRELAGSA